MALSKQNTLPSRWSSILKVNDKSSSYRRSFTDVSFQKDYYFKKDFLRHAVLQNGKTYHAYFCHASEDCTWVKQTMNRLESAGFVCAQYERDFMGGELILTNITMFMFSSNRVVFVLSPDFLLNAWAMYQLRIALSYSVDHDENIIVPVIIQKCHLPEELLPFPLIDATEDDDHWWKQFLDVLKRPVSKLPKVDICSSPGLPRSGSTYPTAWINLPRSWGHVSIGDLRLSNISCVSAPTGSFQPRDPPRISKELRLKIKIWHRSKSRSMDFSQDIHQEHKTEEREKEKHEERRVSVEETESHVTPLSRSTSYDTKTLRPEANLGFSLQLRTEGKDVFESLQTRSSSDDKDLSLVEGDVLEIISKERSSNNSILCRNCFGQTGKVPFQLIGPSLFLLPLQLLKIVQQPITAEENDRFRKELESLGCPQFLVKESVEKSPLDTMHLSVKKGDVLQLIDPTQFPARRLKARNCRNYAGYVQSDCIIRIYNEGLSSDEQSFPS